MDAWLAALDERHFADLTPSEVTRALRALSSCYVERREKLATGGALDGAGKRAAFALFYGPQHFLIAREIFRAIRPVEAAERPAEAADRPAEAGLYKSIIDLGCGTGSAGAAIALETGASVEGYDLNSWAVAEANWTYRTLGIQGRARVENIRKVQIKAAPGTLVLAAYAVNELPDEVREASLRKLMDARGKGAAVLVVEPIGRRVNLWWPAWAKAFVGVGGRENEWRFRTALPPRQRALAKAAGLDVQGMTAKSLFVQAG